MFTLNQYSIGVSVTVTSSISISITVRKPPFLVSHSIQFLNASLFDVSQLRHTIRFQKAFFKFPILPHPLEGFVENDIPAEAYSLVFHEKFSQFVKIDCVVIYLTSEHDCNFCVMIILNSDRYLAESFTSCCIQFQRFSI